MNALQELNAGLASMGEPSTVETQVVSGIKYKFSFDNGDQVPPMYRSLYVLDPLLLSVSLGGGFCDMVAGRTLDLFDCPL